MAGPLRAIGLMSGTSADGIDAAVVVTAGEREVTTGRSITVAYEPGLRARLRALAGADEREIGETERAMTLAHAGAVAALIGGAGLSRGSVDVIGFHGHTVRHEPERGRTRQIGDGALLARETGIDVVCDFRAADVAAGGQGAPLVPVFHAALAAALAKPLAILNLGGVANLTWIGEDPAALLGFDTGPGNALLDDWAERHTGVAQDRDGELASAGCVNEPVLAALLDDPFFAEPPPKSLDRDRFGARAWSLLERVGVADGAATLAAFTAEAVAAARKHLPAPPRRWLVSGGGRRNPALMAALSARLGAPAAPVEAVGWDGDALEAQAFAYLAVRALRALPITFPSTTGAPAQMTGGVVHRAA
jgi:anhydro-N-acetylmuramic acid kinase